jgi:hypothetical protein
MGWRAPQLERGGEQLDGRVERPLGDQPARLGGLLVGLLGLLVGEHKRIRGRSHAAHTTARASDAPASERVGDPGRESGGWKWTLRTFFEGEEKKKVLCLLTRRRGANAAHTQMGRPTHCPTHEYLRTNT